MKNNEQDYESLRDEQEFSALKAEQDRLEAELTRIKIELKRVKQRLSELKGGTLISNLFNSFL